MLERISRKKVSLLAAMVKAGATVTMMKHNMDRAEWFEKELLALDYMNQQFSDISTSLSSDVWLRDGME